MGVPSCSAGHSAAGLLQHFGAAELGDHVQDSQGQRYVGSAQPQPVK